MRARVAGARVLRTIALRSAARAIAAAPGARVAQAGGTITQCNNVGTVGGATITCTVTITNNFTYNAATPNNPTGLATIVTVISCVGAICPTGGTTTSTTPVTGITQCNNAGLGGASTVTCTVTVTNNLTGYPIGAAINSTVRQCQNPGGVTTLTCVATPPGNNRTGSGGPGGQSVIQCNNSGGAGGTLTCTVTAPPSQSTGLPTAINQCNASGTTGASTVTCTATITNNFINSIAGGPGGPGGGGPDGGGPGGGGPGGGGPGGGGPDGGGPGGGGLLTGAGEGAGAGGGDGSGAGDAACEDGVDNDNDGKVDFPDDRGCSSADDTSEGAGGRLAFTGGSLVLMLFLGALTLLAGLRLRAAHSSA